jgi:hypothetical protein
MRFADDASAVNMRVVVVTPSDWRSVLLTLPLSLRLQ